MKIADSDQEILLRGPNIFREYWHNPEENAARFHGGVPGVLQGTYSYVLQDDDGQIAVCWDKVGLDHNGGLLPAGDHTVLLLGVGHKTVPAAEWPEFLEQQQALIAASKAARHAADVARKAVK